MTMNFNGRVWEADETVPSGESRIIELPAASPAAVAIFPEAGATATVSVTLSTLARLKANTARWLPAALGAAGVVTAAEGTDILTPITAIRVAASGGDVAVEVQQ